MRFTRQQLLETLKAYKADLEARTQIMPGAVMTLAMRKMLETHNGRYPTFLRYLPKKYQELPKGRLQTAWRTVLVFLKNRVVLDQGELFRFVTAKDDRVRRNHAALEGFVCHKQHWALNPQLAFNIIPPLDFNCRCQIVPVNQSEASRMLRAKGLKFYMTRKLPVGAVGYTFKGG